MKRELLINFDLMKRDTSQKIIHLNFLLKIKIIIFDSIYLIYEINNNSMLHFFILHLNSFNFFQVLN